MSAGAVSTEVGGSDFALIMGTMPAVHLRDEVADNWSLPFECITISLDEMALLADAGLVTWMSEPAVPVKDLVNAAYRTSATLLEADAVRPYDSTLEFFAELWDKAFSVPVEGRRGRLLRPRLTRLMKTLDSLKKDAR